MYISLYDLGMLILFVMIVVVGGYLIAVLYRLFRLIGLLRDVISENRADIVETISALPQALASINEMAASVRAVVEQTSTTLAPLQNGFLETIQDLRGSLEALFRCTKALGKVFGSLFSK